MDDKDRIRVLVVDDYEPWRRFVARQLHTKPELQVIGEAADGLEALRQAQELQPDLVLLDIGLPLLHGIAAARKMRDLAPNSRILFVSENRAGDLASEALRTGAGGYVVKSDAAAELLTAVEAILQDRAFLSSSLGNREQVISGLRRRNHECSRHELSLYTDDAAFVDDFAHSIEAALENGNAVVVLATESHRANVLQRLRADGLDMDAAADQRMYVSLDASPLAAARDSSTGEDERPNVVPRAIMEALESAKEKRLHLAVG